MPPKKQPSCIITSSGRTIKPRIELETYSSLEENSSSDADSDAAIPSLAPSTSRKRKGGRKRNPSVSSSIPSTGNFKEYQEKRAKNNDAVRRSRQRRREKQMEAQAWLGKSNMQRKKLQEMDSQLDDEINLLKMIIDQNSLSQTVNLSKFLGADAITKLMMQSVRDNDH